jgi:tetratricopeptide (TPR) repeat protein
MREAEFDKPSGGFPMKRLSRILPILALAMLVAVPLYAQNSGSLVGKVLGRDGQPAANVQLQIDSLMLNNGRLQVRERLTAKTGRNGEFTLSGLYPGRVMVTVLENGREVMSHGDKVGDEMFIANGIDLRVPTFDLAKAPPPAAAAPAANTSNMTDEEKKALKEKIEKEAAAAGDAAKAFDAGKVAYAAKDYPEAIRQFKLASEKQPSQDVIWANLGKVYNDARQYDDSIFAYGKAIALKPLESNYFVNLSLAQIGAGKIDEATKSVEQAATLNPANAGLAYYNLSVSLINKGKASDALGPLEKAITLDPKYAAAHYQMGMVKVQMNKLNEAPKHFQDCIDLGAACTDAATAKLMIDELKKIPTTSITNTPAPAAGRGGNAAPAPAGNRGARGQN